MLSITAAFNVIALSYHFNKPIQLIEIGHCLPTFLMFLYTSIIFSNKMEIVTHFRAKNGEKIERFHIEIHGIDAVYTGIMGHLLNWMAMKWPKNRERR